MLFEKVLKFYHSKICLLLGIPFVLKQNIRLGYYDDKLGKKTDKQTKQIEIKMNKNQVHRCYSDQVGWGKCRKWFILNSIH